jgi:hypothetical protein
MDDGLLTEHDARSICPCFFEFSGLRVYTRYRKWYNSGVFMRLFTFFHLLFGKKSG